MPLPIFTICHENFYPFANLGQFPIKAYQDTAGLGSDTLPSTESTFPGYTPYDPLGPSGTASFNTEEGTGHGPLSAQSFIAEGKLFERTAGAGSEVIEEWVLDDQVLPGKFRILDPNRTMDSDGDAYYTKHRISLIPDAPGTVLPNPLGRSTNAYIQNLMQREFRPLPPGSVENRVLFSERRTGGVSVGTDTLDKFNPTTGAVTAAGNYDLLRDIDTQGTPFFALTTDAEFQEADGHWSVRVHGTINRKAIVDELNGSHITVADLPPRVDHICYHSAANVIADAYPSEYLKGTILMPTPFYLYNTPQGAPVPGLFAVPSGGDIVNVDLSLRIKDRAVVTT